MNGHAIIIYYYAATKHTVIQTVIYTQHSYTKIKNIKQHNTIVPEISQLIAFVLLSYLVNINFIYTTLFVTKTESIRRKR